MWELPGQLRAGKPWLTERCGHLGRRQAHRGSPQRGDQLPDEFHGVRRVTCGRGPAAAGGTGEPASYPRPSRYADEPATVIDWTEDRETDAIAREERRRREVRLGSEIRK